MIRGSNKHFELNKLNWLIIIQTGSGMSFGCGTGGYPKLSFEDQVEYHFKGANEYEYYPYKLCMSVFGTREVRLSLISEECGYLYYIEVWITNRYITFFS